MADAFQLTVAEVPAIPALPPVIDIGSAAIDAGTAPVAESINAGEKTVMVNKLNRNAARQDELGRIGPALFALRTGELKLSVTAGSLTLAVSKGHVAMPGPAGLDAAGTLAIPAGAGRVFAWLSDAGALAYTANTTPPALAPTKKTKA